jgi:hypothetical protein
MIVINRIVPDTPQRGCSHLRMYIRSLVKNTQNQVCEYWLNQLTKVDVQHLIIFAGSCLARFG